MENHRFISNRNCNTIGTLFGGDLLRWFDEESALFAYECLDDEHPKRMTTVCVYSFNFLKPICMGHRVRSLWNVAHVGKTSLTVKGTYEEWIDHEWREAAIGYACLCTVNEEGRPTALHLHPEININEIKAHKDWEIIEKFKSLTKLTK